MNELYIHILYAHCISQRHNILYIHTAAEIIKYIINTHMPLPFPVITHVIIELFWRDDNYFYFHRLYILAHQLLLITILPPAWGPSGLSHLIGRSPPPSVLCVVSLGGVRCLSSRQPREHSTKRYVRVIKSDWALYLVQHCS